MQHDRIFGAQALQVMQRLAAGNEIVLGQRLQPADAAAAFAEQIFVMLGAADRGRSPES